MGTNEQTKRCTKCGIEKELSQFHKGGKAKDGLRADCKECVNKARRKRFSDNPEHERAINTKSRMKPENMAKRMQYHRQWRKDNPDKVEMEKSKHRLSPEAKQERNKHKYILSILNAIKRHKTKKAEKEKKYKSICAKYNFNPDTPKEEWRSVLYSDGEYKVSNHGKVRSLKSNKVLKQFITDYGYMRVKIYRQGRGQNIPVHRLVAEAFIDNPYNKPQVNHIDMDKTNNMVNNLEWCTQADNMRHRYAVIYYKSDQ